MDRPYFKPEENIESIAYKAGQASQTSGLTKAKLGAYSTQVKIPASNEGFTPTYREGVAHFLGLDETPTDADCVVFEAFRTFRNGGCVDVYSVLGLERNEEFAKQKLTRLKSLPKPSNP